MEQTGATKATTQSHSMSGTLSRAARFQGPVGTGRMVRPRGRGQQGHCRHRGGTEMPLNVTLGREQAPNRAVQQKPTTNGVYPNLFSTPTTLHNAGSVTGGELTTTQPPETQGDQIAKLQSDDLKMNPNCSVFLWGKCSPQAPWGAGDQGPERPRVPWMRAVLGCPR